MGFNLGFKGLSMSNYKQTQVLSIYISVKVKMSQFFQGGPAVPCIQADGQTYRDAEAKLRVAFRRCTVLRKRLMKILKSQLPQTVRFPMYRHSSRGLDTSNLPGNFVPFLKSQLKCLVTTLNYPTTTSTFLPVHCHPII